jgi:molybdate transport system ATP-binding protein
VLRADVHKRLGEFQLAAAIRAESPSTLVLVGESGSGKTTLVRLLAGLERPDRGHIGLGGEIWFDSPARTWLPPERRSIGYVAQDDALFPHLTALDNVAFGPRAARLRDPQERARRALERLGVVELAARRPRELSGGQRQRVAIARAIAVEPKLLLLDEPLTGLDVTTRRAVRAELVRLASELNAVTIFVTHHPTEALALGGPIAVLAGGEVSQVGSGDELLRHPRSAFVADFMGLNLLRGPIESTSGDLVHVRVGESHVAAAADGEAFAIGDTAFVVVDPREVTLSTAPPSGSAQNQLRGAIVELTPEPPHGDRLRVTIGSTPALVAEITRAAAEQMALVPGTVVHASFKATGARAFR